MEALARKDRGLPAEGDEGQVPKWILHDLRRTATTGMARLKVPPHVADKILNHTGGTISGVAAVYNRFAYLDERSAALEAWASHVMALVKPEKDHKQRHPNAGAASNVVQMRQRRKRQRPDQQRRPRGNGRS